jgi:hypothetical protein
MQVFFNANTERHENGCSFKFNDAKEKKFVWNENYLEKNQVLLFAVE